jgi:hypothetical protein
MLLQTLRIRDSDELAGGFRRWDLRFRQLGGGSFRGELQFLQLGATQILRASGNRRLQAQATGSGWCAAPTTTCGPSWESPCPYSSCAGDSA